MLQEQSRLFQRMLFFVDMLLVAGSWIAAYYIRFDLLRAVQFFPPPEWLPLTRYLGFLPWVLIMSALVFWTSGLYETNRAVRITRLVYSIARTTALGLLVVAATLSFYRTLNFSRLHMMIFGALTPTLMVLFRLVLYSAIHRARRAGKYHRRVLIVGAGRVGRKLARAFEQYPWMGFEVVGFLDDHKRDEPGVLGGTDETIPIIEGFEAEHNPIQYVYLALPLSAAGRIEQITSALSAHLTHVCLVPDLFQFNILNSRVTDIDGQPVIHLLDEAPMELRRVVKRLFDIAFSGLFLLLASPLMLFIALAVKRSSPGPVFYRQERMGLNGHMFNMLKFRSMPVDAERSTGAVWAEPDQQRATHTGAFLRKTSLDELPQFINVLKGDMSVVGPRPERPVFIDQFRERVPGYMLRHKVKSGITGWAQVNGWRGDTSLEKRIEFDLYYIQHWSLKFDFKIMVMTVFRGFVNENAY